MPVSGRINVDAAFTDSAESGITKNAKRLVLQDATEYTSGKVAIVSGTCSTTAPTVVAVAPTTYKNATGVVVSFANVSRVAFAASGAELVQCYGDSVVGSGTEWKLFSRAGQVALSEAFEKDSGFFVQVASTAAGATASFTLIMYGS